MPSPDRTLIQLFARAPRPGHTKTRLIPALGAEGAAQLYRAFLLDTLASARSVEGAAVETWIASERDRAWFITRQEPCRLQRGADLGQRMSAALAHGLERYSRVLLIGTDAPTAPPSLLAQAAEALHDAEIVLGPTADGGYFLIGAAGAAPTLDGVRWSSRHTLADTVVRVGGAATLAPWYDVDTPADLRLLRLHLTLHPSSAPHTARWLADHVET